MKYVPMGVAAGLLLAAGAAGLWSYAQETPPAPGGAPGAGGPGARAEAPRLAPPPGADEIQRQAQNAALQAEAAAARKPIENIYHAIFQGDIDGILANIDFSELMLNNFYVGGEYQKATPTRRHDLEETLVRALSVGSITRQQLDLVLATLQVAFDYTDRAYATFLFTNPAGRITWGKVRKVAAPDGTNAGWMVYAINGG